MGISGAESCEGCKLKLVLVYLNVFLLRSKFWTGLIKSYPGSEPSRLRERRGKGKKVLGSWAPNSVLPITHVTTPNVDLPLGASPGKCSSEKLSISN